MAAKWPIVSIIIPTFNNFKFVHNCIKSISLFTPNIYELIVVNNGHKDSLGFLRENEKVNILKPDHNLGWQDALNLGMKHAKGEYFLFMNDDTQILDGDAKWLTRMLQTFRYGDIGAVGPISNLVMGTQNMFGNLGRFFMEYETTLLIGFCLLVSRKAMEKVGELDGGLIGGDDLDLSIRLRQAGFRLMVNRRAFVYHHGFQTGDRVYGREGWVGEEKTDRTNIEIIKKHGLKKWHDCLSCAVKDVPQQALEDQEGNLIRSWLPEKGKIFEVGCGAEKTQGNIIGVDKVKKGEPLDIFNVRNNQRSESVADIQADVFVDNFAETGSLDAIIARHILEHALNPIEVISHWAKMLKPGGRLIVAVPNEEQGESTVLNPDHKHAFTKGFLTDIMKNAGLMPEFLKDAGNEVSLVGVFKKHDTIGDY